MPKRHAIFCVKKYMTIIYGVFRLFIIHNNINFVLYFDEKNCE